MQKSICVVPSTSFTFSGLERNFCGSPSGTHQTWQHPSPGGVQPFPAFFPLSLLCSLSFESPLSSLPWHTEMNPKGKSVSISGVLFWLCSWLPFCLLVVGREGKDFKPRYVLVQMRYTEARRCFRNNM